MAEYIDKEKVVKLFQGKCEFCKKQEDCSSRKGSHRFCWVCMDLPTEDVAPVKHGKWIYVRSHYEADECKCSLCNQIMTTHKDERMDYCPKCGAKMDGDTNDVVLVAVNDDEYEIQIPVDFF